ncbi:MAG: hypothetical protein AB8B80_05630 [Marinicellaceae bacterium]
MKYALILFLVILITDNAVAEIKQCATQVNAEQVSALTWEQLPDRFLQGQDFGVVFYVQGEDIVGTTIVQAFKNYDALLVNFLNDLSNTQPLKLVYYDETNGGCDLGKISVNSEMYESEPFMNEVLDLIQQRLVNLSLITGFDYEELRQPLVDHKNDVKLLLNTFVYMFDGVNNEKSLRKQWQNLESSNNNDTLLAIKHMNYIWIQSGLIDSMFGSFEKEQAHYDQLLSQLAPSNKPSKFMTFLKALNPISSAMALDGSQLLPIIKPPKTAAALSELMQLQFGSEINGRPSVSRYRDASGAVASIGFSALNKASGGKIAYLKALDAVGDTYNNAIMIWGFLDKLAAGFFPNKLINERADYGSNILNLVNKTKGEVTAFWVTPQAPGIDIGKVILGTAIQTGKINSSLSKLSQSTKLVGFLNKSGMGRNINRLSNLLRLINKQTHGSFADATHGMGAWRADNQALPKAPDLIKIDKFDYPEVNILDPNYIASQSIHPKIIKLELFDKTNKILPYTAVNEGDALIYLNSNGAKFANNKVNLKLPVKVENDTMKLLPSYKLSMPNKTYQFKFTAKSGLNIDDYLVEPSTGTAIDSISTINKEAGIYRIAVKTPKDLNHFPASITVRSKHNKSKTVSSSLVLPKLSPSVDCVDKSQTIQFKLSNHAMALAENVNELTIVGDGLEANGVIFEDNVTEDDFDLVLSGPGKLSQQWLYQPPQNKSKEVVVIALKDKATGMVIDKRELSLNCQCQWSVSTPENNNEGTQAYAAKVTDGWVLMLSDPNHTDSVTITLSNKTASVGIHSFDSVCRTEHPFITDYVNGSAMMLLKEKTFIAGHYSSCQDDDPHEMPKSPQLSIETITDEFVYGSMSGFMYKQSGQKMLESWADLNFKAVKIDTSSFGLLGSITDGPINAETAVAMSMVISQMGLLEMCGSDDEED